MPCLLNGIHRSILNPPHGKKGEKEREYAHNCVALLIYEEKSMNKWMGFQWV